MNAACLIVWICLAVAGLAADRKEIWIDTDMAFGLWLRDHDDGFAVARALRSERLRVRGISTSYGNASEDQARQITRRLLREAGSRVSIWRGAEKAGAFFEPRDAVCEMARALQKRRLTIVALGPLTNVAALLVQHPDAAHRIDAVIALAGRTPGYRPHLRGSAYRFSDANYRKDPEAVLRVLRSGVPVRLVPWETASQIKLDRRAVVRASRQDALGGWLARGSGKWFAAWRLLGRQRKPPAFDSALIMAAEEPEIFRWERRGLIVSGCVDEPRAFVIGQRNFLLASRAFDSGLEAEIAFLPDAGLLIVNASVESGSLVALEKASSSEAWRAPGCPK